MRSAWAPQHRDITWDSLAPLTNLLTARGFALAPDWLGLAWLGLAHLFFPLAVLTDCIRPGRPPRWRHLSRHSIPRAVNVSVTVWLHHESKPNPSSPVNGVWKVKVSTFRKKWPFSPDRKIKFQITKAKEKPTKQVKKVKKNVFFSYDFHLCMPRQHCQEIYSNF